ncbi:MazG-like family protein [Bacillus carboniphilus]|uniref:MazG-like family protein n=1 Tax=Bacillus carboniphilus TaxID=86663 RepID=A0ABY9JW67_9BACI|nr:MazG-like family protein [Bacillus carboniphilus]WLR42722.1 MazG-like family protein [Bacillus carboniphilus]
MDIRELQQHAVEFVEEKGFERVSFEQRIMYLMSELGELTDDCLKFQFEQDVHKKQEIKENIGLEMFDVVWNIAELANRLEIDLTEAFEKKIMINQTRTW